MVVIETLPLYSTAGTAHAYQRENEQRRKLLGVIKADARHWLPVKNE